MGKLPFQYLSVPVSSKKLKALDCEILADKITTRMRSWGFKNLSNAGRNLLIMSCSPCTLIGLVFLFCLSVYLKKWWVFVDNSCGMVRSVGLECLWLLGTLCENLNPLVV